MGKARTALLKSITIPRLELTAAVLASRLDKIIRREIGLSTRVRVLDRQYLCDEIHKKQRQAIPHLLC